MTQHNGDSILAHRAMPWSVRITRNGRLLAVRDAADTEGLLVHIHKFDQAARLMGCSDEVRFDVTGPETRGDHACECEHSDHFDDDWQGNPKPRTKHAYGAICVDAKPAAVAWMHGSYFCDDCRLNCHDGAQLIIGTERESEPSRMPCGCPIDSGCSGYHS